MASFEKLDQIIRVCCIMFFKGMLQRDQRKQSSSSTDKTTRDRDRDINGLTRRREHCYNLSKRSNRIRVLIGMITYCKLVIGRAMIKLQCAQGGFLVFYSTSATCVCSDIFQLILF